MFRVLVKNYLWLLLGCCFRKKLFLNVLDYSDV